MPTFFRCIRLALLLGFCAFSVLAVDVVVIGPSKIPPTKSKHTYAILPANLATLKLPPPGVAYRDNPESHRIWRELGLLAPDYVIVIEPKDSGLAAAISTNAVAGMGPIPALSVSPRDPDPISRVPVTSTPSAAHVAQQRSLARSEAGVASQLASVYGQKFDPPVYISAMALIARVRMGQVAEVEAMVAPYVNGSKDSLANATSSHFAGHLLFAELADVTSKKDYIERVRAAADVAMAKPMHNEMSDSVFMVTPLLAAAGSLTGDAKYFDAALEHFNAMRKLDLRPDGLYRHSPLNEAAWGRGNAFPALGLAWTLSYLPRDNAAFQPILKEFRAHMQALAKFQSHSGMWREVIDHPESYEEFSATAMIATAMHMGLRYGWLDYAFSPPESNPAPSVSGVDRAWSALRFRIGITGDLMDVCESTGKQKTLEDYLNRAASLGHDDRGGGMALILLSEMAKK